MYGGKYYMGFKFTSLSSSERILKSVKNW